MREKSMTCKLSRLVSLVALIPCLATGQVTDTPSPEVPGAKGLYLIGVVKSFADMGKNFDNYCFLKETKYPKSSKALFVSGFVSCSKSYGGSVGFYEVYEGDEKFFIAEDKITVDAAGAERLKLLEGEEKEAFSQRAHSIAVTARREELKTLLSALKVHQKFGLSIVSASIEDESEYTDGTSFYIDVVNPTEKTVKYLWFTVTGYNAVGDTVRDRLRNATAITVKGVGPINKNQSGKYSFSYLWHTDLVQTFKINRIKVQYMDGSIKQIDNVKSITFNASQRGIWDEI